MDTPRATDDHEAIAIALIAVNNCEDYEFATKYNADNLVGTVRRLNDGTTRTEKYCQLVASRLAESLATATDNGKSPVELVTTTAFVSFDAYPFQATVSFADISTSWGERHVLEIVKTFLGGEGCQRWLAIPQDQSSTSPTADTTRFRFHEVYAYEPLGYCFTLTPDLAAEIVRDLEGSTTPPAPLEA